MSMETYDELLSTNHINKAIFEAEREVAEGAEKLCVGLCLNHGIWGDKLTEI